MSFDAQVAVIGGGVAGAAACRSLALEGLRVVWVQPGKPENHVHVGESLAPSAKVLLQHLGLQHLLEHAAHRPANTRFSAWGRPVLVENHAMTSIQGAGYVLDRAVFEDQLRDAVKPAVQCIDASLQGCSPLAQSYALRLSDGLRLNVPWVVDASGRAAAFSRQFTPLKRLDQLVGAVSFAQPVGGSVQPTQATLIEAVESGWWYASLLADQRLVVAFFSDPDLLPAGVSRNSDAWFQLLESTQYVSRWLQETGFQPKEPPGLHTAGTTWLETPAFANEAGAGWLAAGDAAFAMDPLSSHGIASALWGGWRAGQVVSAAVKGNTTGFAAYVAQVQAGRARYLHERGVMYGNEQRFAGAPFWRRRQSAGV